VIGRVSLPLVGDRFVRRYDDQWMDIVTGARVQFDLFDIVQPRETIEQHWAEIRAGTDAASRALVDYGAVGARQWFVAWTTERPRAVPSAAEAEQAARFTQAVIAACDAPTMPGFVCVRAPVVSENVVSAACQEAARQARALGFVTFRADVALPAAVRRELDHRHTVILVAGGDAADAAREWVRRLSAVSPRRHVVVAIGPPPRLAVNHADLVSERVSRYDRSASDLGARHRPAGLRGVRRGRNGMARFDDVSTLLHLVHDAEDEHAALKRGCGWVRERTSASAVGVVSGDGATLVFGDAFSKAALETPEVRDALAGGAARAIVNGPNALVTTPVRYCGVIIGFIVIRGEQDAVSALVDAGTALASACAPALRARLDALALAGAGQTLAPDILGISPSIIAVRQAIARAAATTFPVLVEGESGTGKELVARALHRLSARRDRRLCAVNCAALTDELIEAELFGYTRGAFTGAVATRTGLFEEAHHGTLFLDEVSELSPRAQAKLLRVLQEREIRRVGENAPRPVDVRVVAATNRPLVDAVGQGRFREDLLFRLAVVRIRVPTLRDRLEDVPLLAQAFWRALTAGAGKRAILGPDAIAALCRYRWAGNVRELQNVISALVVSAPTRGRVCARHVHQVLADANTLPDLPGASLDKARAAFERRMVSAALVRHGGRRTRAAVELGLSRQGLAKAIKRLGLRGVA